MVVGRQHLGGADGRHRGRAGRPGPLTGCHPRLPPGAVEDLRGALVAAGYTTDRVRGLLGPVAATALDRNETTPGRRTTQVDASPLATLTRLWPLQVPVDAAAARRALGPAYAPLLAAGLLAERDGATHARLDVRPYATDERDWWVVCDRPPNVDGRQPPTAPDHVLGPSPASSTLAQLTIQRPVGAALDLGTGCGVQLLHLAEHAARRVGTDVNPRALALAELTCALNGTDADLREGDLYAPVAGERFDLVVSNPPFVVGPPTSPSRMLAYREAGLPGDELCRRVVTEGAAVLADGGVLQTLATWLHRPGEPWEERVAAWVTGTGCDAWVVQREVQDPAEHAEVWLRDSGEVSGPGYTESYGRWLDWFAATGADGVGFGWVVLRRTGAAAPDVRIEAWPHPVRQPLGPEVERRLAAVDLLRPTGGHDLLGLRLAVADDVVQETVGEPGADDPASVVLRRRDGLLRARPVDTATAAVVGACDGTLPLGALVDAAAAVLEEDPATLTADLAAPLRELFAEGFLVAADRPAGGAA